MTAQNENICINIRYGSRTLEIVEIKKMTDDQICSYFDSHPDITLADMSRITGKSIAALKKILMS